MIVLVLANPTQAQSF